MMQRITTGCTYLVILFSLPSYTSEKAQKATNASHSDELALFYAKNQFGMTPLHFTPWLFDARAITATAANPEMFKPQNASDQKRLEETDLNKARTAAFLIKLGVSVSEKDNFGKSPFDYAKGMRSVLPQVYEVMNAGKIIQDVRTTLPQPDNNGAYDLNELVAFGNSPKSKEIDLMAWHNAEQTLQKYLPKE